MQQGSGQDGDLVSFTLQDGQVLLGPAVVGTLEPLVSR